MLGIIADSLHAGYAGLVNLNDHTLKRTLDGVRRGFIRALDGYTLADVVAHRRRGRSRV